MKIFSGFPEGKVRNVRLPEDVFTTLVPLIDDLAELKLTLHVYWLLSQQRHTSPYVLQSELTGDETLLSGLGDNSDQALSMALERAVERGSLLRAIVLDEPAYFANTPKGRAAVAESASPGQMLAEEHPARTNIFVLYEENIGALTPLIADELREAEQAYPPEWIEEAFREAVAMNKRSWKYTLAILERWSKEGRGRSDGRRSDRSDRQRYTRWKTG